MVTTIVAPLGVTPEEFSDTEFREAGLSATAALQAAHDWCWNGGNIRGYVQLIPAANPYLIDDPNLDGKGVIFNTGVSLVGAGKSTTLKATTAGIKTLYVQRVDGGWKRARFTDFWVDGDDIAASGVEFYGDAYVKVSGLTVIDADRGFVIDASQNHVFTGCVAQHSRISWSFLNGAGSVDLDACSSDAAEDLHILIDNDDSYPGYSLMSADPPLAYQHPTMIMFRGGVFERARDGSALKAVARINTATDCSFERVVFGATSDCDAVVEFGRHNLAAAYLSSSSFRIASVDCAAYFVPGRRVKVTGTASVYGVVSTSTYTGGHTNVVLTMDGAEAVPNEALTVSIGREDDVGQWESYLAGGAIQGCQIYGAAADLPGIRNGSTDALFDGIVMRAVGGDWIETSRPVAISKIRGSLEATKLRSRHIKGLVTGTSEISYTPLRAANAGTFEEPGHASAFYYSSAGSMPRWRDAVNSQNRIIPTNSSGVVDPTFSATAIAQRYINTATDKEFVATDTGTGASDWQILN